MTARWARRTTVGSVLLVGVVAAVVSYAHMLELADRSGEGWRAWLIPLSVDGMLVAATLAIVDRRRVHQPAGWVPWTGLGLGIGASLAANIAAAQPGLVSQLVAAWPPVALAVSIETLVMVLRVAAPVKAGVPVLPSPELPGPPTTEPKPPPAAPVEADPDDLLARARELVADGAGRPRLRAELQVSDHRARLLLEQVRQPNGVAVLS